ncbi:MAG: winged helix-turn-helix domain-containing protein [Kluyvera sp.]|uniref:winged helix-turn-helix domain-containing protein n=1 Tax=Kluyvera sp. TaxID=1538228 RepID=UPI003F2D9B77
MIIYIISAVKGTLLNKKTGVETRLGEHEQQTLKILMQNYGVIMNTDELIQQVWQKKCVTRGSLIKVINSLRYTLKDTPPYKIIMTAPRKGYWFNPQAISLFGQSRI